MSLESNESPTAVLPNELNDYLFSHRNLIAAASASFVSTIAGFPLDSIKARIQVKRYSSVLDCAQRTLAEEGVRGFFRGVYIPLLTITVVRTASFSIYSGVKDRLVRNRWVDEKTAGGIALSSFAGGAASGILLSCGTSAFEYTKIKLREPVLYEIGCLWYVLVLILVNRFGPTELEYLIAMKKGIAYEPRGTVQGFLDLYRSGGIRSLYTGFPLHAARDTLGTGFYFCFYDTTRRLFIDNPSIPLPHVLSTFMCGSAAGVTSWAVIYPIDLIKSKSQRNALAGAPYESPSSIFRRLSAGGVRKLYRGLGVSAFRSIFTHGLMWTILEKVRGEITIRTGHSIAEDQES